MSLLLLSDSFCFFYKIKEVVLKVENDLKEELKESDEHVFVRLEKVDSLNEVISVKESQDIISMMYLMPNGFMHKSLKMENHLLTLSTGKMKPWKPSSLL